MSRQYFFQIRDDCSNTISNFPLFRLTIEVPTAEINSKQMYTDSSMLLTNNLYADIRLISVHSIIPFSEGRINAKVCNGQLCSASSDDQPQLAGVPNFIKQKLRPFSHNNFSSNNNLPSSEDASIPKGYSISSVVFDSFLDNPDSMIYSFPSEFIFTIPRRTVLKGRHSAAIRKSP